MKKFIFLLGLVLILYSCDRKEQPAVQNIKSAREALSAFIPVDKGFSRYIASYTSGIVPSTGQIQIQFTPEFAATADKQAKGLFEFTPGITGREEWKDDVTLVFIPSKPLDPGKSYTGKLKLGRLANVEGNLAEFPVRIQTLRKDFRVSLAALEASGNNYNLNGQVTTTDFIEPAQVEKIITVRLGREKQVVTWDHSKKDIHVFSVKNIQRRNESQKLGVEWNGNEAGIKQKGGTVLNIPPAGQFAVLDVMVSNNGTQRIDLILSDPTDPSQELTGLVHLPVPANVTAGASPNIITILPASRLEGTVDLTVEASLRNSGGSALGNTLTFPLDFSQIKPAILLEGDGIIMPSSNDLIFPFKAAGLKAVDLRIIKIFENNLPYFLQENDITGGYSMKQFGRPVYYGRYDLVNTPGMNEKGWNLYTIDLSDYIDVEPGVLYKVTLSMRKSYALYPCESSTDSSPYEELLQEAVQKFNEAWDDPDVYYDDPLDQIYYYYGFDWSDRDDPCKEAYYSPDRKESRNVFASNLGLIAKKGDDNIMHVMVNDLISALPVNEATVDIYDYQLQKIISGTTNQNGTVALKCERQPFLVTASRDKDRNYLKTTDGNSLSLSSFDVSGTKPEKGLKAFVYGERDVWRPGDSIFLSVFIKDMTASLPKDHPVLFELINPMEQKVDNQVMRANGSNLIVFKTSTDPGAVTGNYRAVVKIGGATFSKRIRIETVKPNRLKIELVFGKDILGGTEKYEEGTLKVRWLNGNVARNLKSSVEYLLRPVTTRFEKYPQYIFDDPVKKMESETVNIFDGRINENGDATIVFNPPDEHGAPGMLNAIFTARSSEPGGDESITTKTFRFAPYDVFAGINFSRLQGKERMLYTDEDNEVKVVSVDAEGRPVNSEIEITVYKLNYRWWWESDDDNLGYYISNEYYSPVLTRTVETTNGTGLFKFRIDKKDWGRYLVRATAPSGHSTGKIILVDWPWEYGAKGRTDGATLLAVSTDKEKYNSGDEISLVFPSPENSRAIITLENSAGVIDEIRTGTGNGSTEVKFKARPEMAPNVYAYVTVIQPHAQTVNDMPVRLYGIVPIMVEDPATRLKPVIDMADELRSARPFSVKVSEKNGKSMTYTLAVVDEGLLDLTGFNTPDPWNYFYAREALGVRTWDLYDNVLGAFGGTLDRILAVGGDEALGDKAAGKAQRFIPVVRFLGPFTLAAGKSNSHSISLPQYTGSVRVMVIAGTEKAFGAAEKNVVVRDPLMVLVTAPRVISPEETVSLPVSLFVHKEGISEVKLTAGGENVRFDEPEITVPVSSAGEITTRFRFSSGTRTGIAKINVTASGGGETASYNMEIDIRNPNPPETRSELKILNKGENWQTAFTTFGTEGTNAALIEISSLPSIDLEKKLDFLVNYPHGCSEQTTSAAFPQLYLKNVRTSDADLVQKINANIRVAISVIGKRQMANGGIAMWPGAAQHDTWVTSYSGHFMLEAERNGFSLPAGFRKKWVNFQSQQARNWRYDPKFRHTSNDQAYRLFTLALAGEPERGAMNRMREMKDLPQLSRWLLSAAYAVSGRPEASQDLLDMRNIGTEPEYRGYYYGSDLRDKSIILYTLAHLKNRDQALLLLKEVCEKFNNTWYSTQDASWALIAYMKFMETMPQVQGSDMKISVTINGQKTDHIIKPEKLTSTDLNIVEGNNDLLVQNTSENPVYVTLSRKGAPLSGDATASQKGLDMKVRYTDLSMKPIDHRKLEQGRDFMMVVEVRNTGYNYVENLALTQMVPSGWEIRNTRLFEARYGIEEGEFDYRDFRDDRVNTYFSLGPGRTKTFVVILSSSYTGVFRQPSVICEAMYTPGVYARVPGTVVTVTPAEN